ncbi:MAG TPA: fused MFS/spermidine synthase [Vicinamibacteria bacterium]|nr:fused MFS/spermidine synthase [Vicinamibacteria bacterium]
MVLRAVAFFLSGAAALVYQVVWQRILTLHTGIGVVSVALIVAAFMGGLGLGSHLGGVLSARVSARQALRLFATIELAVGLFAAASGRLYYDVLGTVAAGLYRTTAGAALAHLLAFLLPTTLMGMSLPFLVRATVRDAESASRVIGGLYGVNVLGASAGALLAPWVLVRHLGMEGAALAGTGANLVAAAAALAAGRREAAQATATRAESGLESPGRTRDPTPLGSLGLWTVLYALSGYLALSLEVVWFRLVDVGVKSTAFTFGTVLCLYLLGLGAGSLAGGMRATRLARPLEAFLDYQLLLLALAGGAVALAAWLPPGFPVYRWFIDYWRHDTFFQLGADWNKGALARLYGLLPVGLFGAPTVLMGLSFGALQRAVQDDPATSGRKVGLLQAANIAGCTAGSLVTGLVLLERIGTAPTLRLLVAAGGLVFLLVRARSTGASRGLAARAVAVALVLVALPSNDRLWKRLHGVTVDEPPSFIGEDASALSVIVPGVEWRWRVTVNGLPHSWLPYEGIHTLLGAVPALIHPAPEEVAVIGLGSGETAWAVACRKETRSLRVYEIAASQPRLLRAVSAVAPFPGLVELISDPRVTMEAADGRRALAREAGRYDIVQVDAMFRTGAGSGNLYSVEFFRLCASRLKPGGLVCTQKPSRRVGLTFAEALPHALDFGNIVVGSNDPIPIDPAAWEARLLSPEVSRRFDPETIAGIRARLRDAVPARRNPGARIGLNRDLFPRDEFATPAGW